MQSNAKTVDAYIAEAPAGRREALARLRDLCRKTLTGFQEGMEYGMPSYSRNGAVEAGFASQVKYISLYLLKQEVLDAFRAQLSGKGVSLGKGCIRYSRPDRIDFEIVEALLIATEKSGAPIC